MTLTAKSSDCHKVPCVICFSMQRTDTYQQEGTGERERASCLKGRDYKDATDLIVIKKELEH